MAKVLGYALGSNAGSVGHNHDYCYSIRRSVYTSYITFCFNVGYLCCLCVSYLLRNTVKFVLLCGIS